MSAIARTAGTAARHTLDRRCVYIFPTRHGTMLGAMMMAILLGSINYDNALGYLLSFLLFGLFLIAMLHTYRNLTGLSYIGAEAIPVFAGTQAQFKLAFDNRGKSPRYSLLLAHWPRMKRRWRRQRRPIVTDSFIASLAANEITLATVAVDAPRRGWLNLQRVRITSVFPLGILRTWAYFEDPAKCLVYPQPEGRLPLPINGLPSEAAASGNSPGNEDFAGFRSYLPGDPIRAIAWKALARQEVVLVKRFTSGGSMRVWLQWADCASLNGTEARLKQLAKWVVDAERLGLSFGLEIPRTRIELGAGATHRHKCLRTLALYDTP